MGLATTGIHNARELGDGSLNCGEARRALNVGMRPGTSSAERRALGFHLSQCPACKAIQLDRDGLLGQLLSQEQPLPRRHLPAPAQAQANSRRPWYLLAGLAIGLVLLVALAPTVRALTAINRDLEAMQLPTITANQALPVPTIAEFAPIDPALIAQIVEIAASPTPSPTPSPRPALATPLAMADDPPDRPAPSPTSFAIVAAGTAQAPLVLQLPTVVGDERVSPSATPVSGSSATLPATVRPPDPDAMHLLIIGVDRRPGEGFLARADALALARFEPNNGRAALLSFPRDLIVPVPGVGYTRINAANVYGESAAAGGGPALTRQTVEQLLNLSIDHVVEIDFSGFVQSIDALGGVTIDVEQALYDATYPTIDYGYQVVHFTTGLQEMDGERALIYSRIRHPDSDFERIKRQQTVLVAILARVRERDLFGQVQALAPLSDAMHEKVRTDIPRERMLELALSLRNLRPEAIERYSIDRSQVSEGSILGDPYALVPYPGAIEQVRAEFLGQ